jgi:hypothetical protein
MKKSTLVVVFLVACVAGFFGLAGTSYAAPIDGRWTGSFEAEGFGTLPIGIDLKADGAKLTGSYDGQFGPVPITKGKIDGDKISFEVGLDVGSGSPVNFKYTGVLKGDKLDIQWTSDMSANPTKATCTRQK